MSAIEDIAAIDNGLLRFLTCGSVDDGKSTLIGRLLYDSKAVLADALHAIERTSKRRGLDSIDLSLLTDGLQAEREQGITIDVAYRYFSSGRRNYIIADAPGHEQYTRNMVTAASTADLAVILVDARRGVLTQTRRHSCIAQMLGIRHLVIAVNKMDLVDYAQDTFDAVRRDYQRFADRVGIGKVHYVPLSALNGDMVVDRGTRLDWHDGPTLLELLETAPDAHGEHAEPLRFPVQYVCRPQAADDSQLHDFRGYMGRIEAGTIGVGDAVRVLPGGAVTCIKDIRIGNRSLTRAVAEQSVTLQLEDDIDLCRGDMIVSAADDLQPRKQIEAMLCWLSETPLDLNRRYLIRHTTREVKTLVAGIAHRLDINTLERASTGRLLMNDIGKVALKLAQPLCADSYAINRTTGAFILIDETTNNTVAAGMIL